MEEQVRVTDDEWPRWSGGAAQTTGCPRLQGERLRDGGHALQSLAQVGGGVEERLEVAQVRGEWRSKQLLQVDAPPAQAPEM